MLLKILSLTKFTLSLQVTNANNQQLIPIARNISFRQCLRSGQQSGSTKQAQFSISASSPTSHFISTDLDSSSIFVDQKNALENLKKRAKDVVEKREIAAPSKYYGQSFNEALATPTERRLVVLMSWLEAKEKHIEKHRQFYLDRGFDVLNVKTSPMDLLLPNVGSKKISQDFVRFLVEKQYSDVVLHGFSVGGYMFGQVLLDIDKQDEQVRNRLLQSIRGLIFDSVVTFEGTCKGVAKSITTNRYLAKLLENLLKLYLILGHNIATKHYLMSSEKVWSGPLKCPSLFLLSKDDRISDYRIIQRLAKVWNDLGIETQLFQVDSAPHVQIFNKHHAAYVEKVESFLKHIKVNQDV